MGERRWDKSHALVYPEVAANISVTAATAGTPAEDEDKDVYAWILWSEESTSSTTPEGRRTQTCTCNSIFSSPGSCLPGNVPELEQPITKHCLFKSWRESILQTAQLWFQVRDIPAYCSHVVRHSDQDGRVEEVEMELSEINTEKR